MGREFTGESAFVDAYSEYFDVVYREALRYSGNHHVAEDNYKETTKKIQTQEMLIFPGFSLCPLICGTPQKSINFLR